MSRPTGRTSFSVISAKASAALRCKSTLSENDRIVSADRGEPVKKFVVVRSTLTHQEYAEKSEELRLARGRRLQANS